MNRGTEQALVITGNVPTRHEQNSMYLMGIRWSSALNVFWPLCSAGGSEQTGADARLAQWLPCEMRPTCSNKGPWLGRPIFFGVHHQMKIVAPAWLGLVMAAPIATLACVVVAPRPFTQTDLYIAAWLAEGLSISGEKPWKETTPPPRKQRGIMNSWGPCLRQIKITGSSWPPWLPIVHSPKFESLIFIHTYTFLLDSGIIRERI